MGEQRLKREHLRKLKEAQDRKDQDAIRKLKAHYSYDLFEFIDTRKYWSQQKWIKKAHKLSVPVPREDVAKIVEEGEDENWVYSSVVGEILLKDRVFLNLKRKVINEQRENLGARATLAVWITAGATAALMVVTWQYVTLTNRLVQLQVEPSVEAGLDESLGNSTTFTIQNDGAEPVKNVVVNIRCLLFRSLNEPKSAVSFVGRDNEHSWWEIGKLAPREALKKDSADVLRRCLAYKESHEDIENKKGGKSHPVTLAAIVTFELSYRRS